VYKPLVWGVTMGKDWHWKAMFFVYGPATVEGALHGASNEAREQWKRHWAERKRIAAEERRARHAERQ
jgi:hypothetical protein